MISVIIPVYNAMNTLKRCVDSVLGQTLQDLEVILVDDCSTDLSEEICRLYTRRDSRVKFFQTPHNAGPAATRNIGLKNSSGEYVQFVDSDDYVSKDISQVLLSRLKECDADMAICGYTAWGQRANKRNISYGNEIATGDTQILALVKKNYETAIVHSCWTKLYKKSAIRDYFDRELPCGEDFVFNMRYIRHITKITTVGQCLYYYDCTAASQTRSKYKLTEDLIGRQYQEAILTLEPMAQDATECFFIYKYYLLALIDNFFMQANIKRTLSRFKTMIEQNETILKIAILDDSVQTTNVLELLREKKYATLYYQELRKLAGRMLKDNAKLCIYRLRQKYLSRNQV